MPTCPNPERYPDLIEREKFYERKHHTSWTLQAHGAYYQLLCDCGDILSSDLVPGLPSENNVLLNAHRWHEEDVRWAKEVQASQTFKS